MNRCIQKAYLKAYKIIGDGHTCKQSISPLGRRPGKKCLIGTQVSSSYLAHKGAAGTCQCDCWEVSMLSLL